MENPETQSFKPVKTATTSILDRGRIPPHDIFLEEIVLGGMLSDKKGVDDVIDILTDDMFYKPSHQIVYKAISELFQNSEPINLNSVIEKLRKSKSLQMIGGEAFLIELTLKTISAAHIQYNARIIQQKYIQRSLIRISTEIIEEAYDESTDVFDLLDSAESKLYNVTQGNLKKSSESSKDLVVRAIKKLKELGEKKNEFSGIQSGFVNIDKVTAGWQPSDLIIVAARPAMGKTAFTLGMARNIAVNSQVGVAFFSLEMAADQLIMRLIAAETKISSQKLRTGQLSSHDWDLLNHNLQALENAPLYIDDTPSLSIFDLRAKARRLVSQHDIKIIIIDYLQLMTIGGSKGAGNREQEISTISRNLKALAKELNIPIIALAQLSRQAESHESGKGEKKHRRPQLSHLRESGAIEQDADIVTFLYRPEYYKIDEWDDKDKTPTQNQAEFIIAKHRNGQLKDIRLRFENGVFSNLDLIDSPEFLTIQSSINAGIANNLPPQSEVFGTPKASHHDNIDFQSSINKDVPF